MESQPVFSIVIATFNYGCFIDQALGIQTANRRFIALLDAEQSYPAVYAGRLHAACSEAAWVLHDSAPAGLRLGALGKITARGLLPPGIHHWMQLIRRHLWA